MQGTIIRGIAGFYYVQTVGSGIYVCKAKGIFRKEKQKPLVGDRVRIEVLDEKDKEANLVEILPRTNALIRPAVANIDQAMLFFALKDPDPDRLLLDRFLVMMAQQKIPVLLCFNKKDLVPEEESLRAQELYTSCGYEVFRISAAEGEGVDDLRARLTGKTTVVAGPSGAGKSTLTNRLQDAVRMETGTLSEKLGRGKNTTRHAELVPVDEETFFCDTPGFTSLELPAMPPEELDRYFPEFAPYKNACRFPDCAHLQEPDCAVREALAEGSIRKERYDSYRQLHAELKEKERRKY